MECDKDYYIAFLADVKRDDGIIEKVVRISREKMETILNHRFLIGNNDSYIQLCMRANIAKEIFLREKGDFNCKDCLKEDFFEWLNNGGAEGNEEKFLKLDWGIPISLREIKRFYQYKMGISLNMPGKIEGFYKWFDVEREEEFKKEEPDISSSYVKVKQ